MVHGRTHLHITVPVTFLYTVSTRTMVYKVSTLLMCINIYEPVCMEMYVVSSNIQSFYQTWNQYKCNCCPESPATGIRTFALIAMTLVGIFLLLFIVVTIGWIWTCRIAIERGKLIKNKGEIMILSNQNYLVTALFMHLSHICREYHSFVAKQGPQCPLNTS